MGRSANGERHMAEPHSGDDGEQCAAQAQPAELESA